MEEGNSVELRRLDPDRDEALVREAVKWSAKAPRWFRDAETVWRSADADEYLRQMKEGPQADFGVFKGEKLHGVVTVSLCSSGVYEAHLMARTDADVPAIVCCIRALMGGLFEGGMREAWSWVLRKNYGVRRILEAVGMVRDGVAQFKGQSHGTPLEWLRYSVRRAA